MSRAIESAMAHFKEVLAQGLKGPIKVPEWNLDVYYKPATTFHQESKIVELTSQGKTVEALVESLIMRALDADGKPLFSIQMQTSCGFRMNLQTRDLGLILHFAHQRHMAVAQLIIAYSVVFHVVLLHLLQQVTTTCMRKS